MKKEENRKKGKSGKKGTKSKKVKDSKKGNSVKKKRTTAARKKRKKSEKTNEKKIKEIENITVDEDFDYDNFGKPDSADILGFVEYLKLIRNCVVLLVAIIAIVMFLKNSLVASDEIDLIVIFSAILFSLIAFLLFVFLVKFIQDMKKGSVYVYKGYVSKNYDDILYSSYLPLCNILLNRMVHFVGFYNYFRIKDNDFVIIRRTQVTRSIVGLVIVREEE
jgi:hypothetical protein